MSRNEMTEFMWLSAMVQMLEKIIETTDDKEWLRRFKTANTLFNKIVAERWADMDDMEQKKAMRRIKQIGIKVYTYDDYRVDNDDQGRKVTFAQEDFLDLVDAAWLNCYGCPQGDVVKDCPRRKMFHRLGLQVHQCRINPAEGECEWRYNNEQYAVTPQYKALEEELLAQMP